MRNRVQQWRRQLRVCIKQCKKNHQWNLGEYSKHFERIWKSERYRHTRIGRILLTLSLVGPRFSLSNWLIEEPETAEAEFRATRLMDWYIFACATFLTALLVGFQR